MSIVVYRDNDSLSIFFEQGTVGAWPLNALQAIGDGSGGVSVRNKAKRYPDGSDFFEIANAPFAEFENESGAAYGATEADVVNALNATFTSNGGAGVAPVITSNLAISLTTGDSLNYELTASDGVGYEWSGLPSGVVTVEGNVRKLIGGSGLTAGSYTFDATAVNYFGTDTETITLTVSNPPFNDTKSVNFVNQDWLGANASLLDAELGRAGNGSGSSDAWTISLWFKPGTSTNNNQTIFYFGDFDVANGGRVQVAYRGGNTSLRLHYGSDNNFLRLDTSASSLTVGQWHHIFITYDGGTTGSSSADLSNYYGRFQIWIDGVSQTTTNSHNNFGWSSGIDPDNLRIGRLAAGNYMRNNCRVDEVAVWGSDESSEVTNVYNSGTPDDLATLTTAPDHWWRMGDGDTFPTLLDTGGAHFVMNNMTAADIVSDTP